MEKLEVNKCYVIISNRGIIKSVVKTFPSYDKRFKNFIKLESINLRSYEFGAIEVSYLRPDVSNIMALELIKYVEIPEEEYQKFYHLWKVYCKSLESARLKLEQKLSYDI